MAMSKKDYVAVAELLNRVLWMEGSCPLTIARVTAGLGIVFEADNPRYDDERFRAAALKQKDGYTKFAEEREALGL
jgi:hypothetical protein